MLCVCILGWIFHVKYFKDDLNFLNNEHNRLKKDRDFHKSEMKRSDQIATYACKENADLRRKNRKMNDAVNKLQRQLDDIQAKRKSRRDLKNEKAKQKGKTSREVFS